MRVAEETVAEAPRQHGAGHLASSDANPFFLPPAAPLGAALPSSPPSHVVVVVEENHGYGEIIGSSSAPTINSLAKGGALMTRSFAVTHPSEPNYLELFSGSTQGITDDSCPNNFTAANLGGQLLAAGRTFVGYSEDLPSAGYTGCTSGGYARKHNPWVMFADVPAASNQPFSAFPQGHFQDLPTVAFVIPNLGDDMHDGSIQTADTWLKTNLDAYVQWAGSNNSLLILTFDEDDNGAANHTIAASFTPAGVTGKVISLDFVGQGTAFNLTAIPGTASDGTSRAPVNGIQIVPSPSASPRWSWRAGPAPGWS